MTVARFISGVPNRPLDYVYPIAATGQQIPAPDRYQGPKLFSI